MQVPFLDLKAQYKTIKDEIDLAIQEVINSSAFSGGPFVEKFEGEFAKFCQSRHCVGVGSGTEALWLALLAMGVGQGDEVITVPNTFVATAEAISFCGADPVFVDVDEKTYTMDPSLVEAAISTRTKAIIPVHLFGQVADMDPIMEIARRKGLRVIEDSCQAHGAEYKGKRAGSIGDAGAFSFYPGKNLGAYGEAGAVTTNEQGLADKVRLIRDHGQAKKYHHEVIGWNARMDGFQGAVLSAKLLHLEAWTKSRRANATLYSKLLGTIDGVTIPVERPQGRHVYHVYAIKVKHRDAVAAYLRTHGVGTGIHYPVPIHKQECYRNSSANTYAVAEKCAPELLSLPMYAELSSDAVEYVCELIRTA